ncbi:MAG: type IV pilus assembly protein PilM [Patescibacteria group bacterium]
MGVGLDIGSKTIKVVELTKDKDKFTLRSAGVVGYTGGEVEYLISDKEFANLSDLIRKLFNDAKIRPKDIALSLPESQVYTRQIKFPLLTDNEIISAVRWEAEQYIPIPLNEAIVQHVVLERRENINPPEVLVLLVAAPRSLVEKYLKIVSGAGLNLVFAETELLALTRSLGQPNQTVLIMDFGARSTDIAISKSGSLIFSRSIPTAGEAFTRAVAKALGVGVQQAEEYKKAYGLSTKQESKVREAIDPIFRIVTDEIKKAIQFYTSEEKNPSGPPPSSLILSGGTAGLPESIPYLSKVLGLEVVIGNPFAKISLDPTTMKSLIPYAPLYSIAVGLAQREP